MKQMDKTVSDFARAMDRLRRAWQNITPCGELSKAQFTTLLAIAYPDFQHGPLLPNVEALSGAARRRTVRLTELSRTMHQSLPALSQRVSTLEALGYVERVPDPDDRRVTGLCLTDEGLRTLQRAYEHIGGMISRAIDRLGQENLRTMLELNELLAEALEYAAAPENFSTDEKE